MHPDVSRLRTDPSKPALAPLSPERAQRRLLAVLGLLITLMFFRDPAALGAAAGCLLFGALWLGVSLRHIVKRLLLIVPFGLGAVVLLPFHGAGAGEGEAVLTVFGYAATEGGVRHALVILFKIVCANLLLTYLIAVTPIYELVASLRRIGVPAVFIGLLGLMLRYFVLLKEESLGMLKAQRSRGLKLDGWFWSRSAYRRFGQLLGALFVRAYQRSGRIYLSMASRGGLGETSSGKDREAGREAKEEEAAMRAQEARQGAPAIEVTDVSYRYGTCEALSAIAFRIEQGAKVALMGPNGAGKSTLIALMNGLEEPTEGAVRLFGETLTRQNGDRLRRHVGVVYQDPDDQIFSMTVAEDVAFGPRNLGCSEAEVAERVAEALDAVGMREHGSRSPFELSYGQKRRVAIAGVLAMRPDIMLFDEPMAFLDPKSRDQLQELLERLHRRGLTLVMATHDVDFAAEWADRVLLLKDGRIVAEGSSDLLFDDELTQRADLHLPRLARPFRLLQGLSPAEVRPKTVREAAQAIWRLALRGVNGTGTADEGRAASAQSEYRRQP